MTPADDADDHSDTQHESRTAPDVAVETAPASPADGPEGRGSGGRAAGTLLLLVLLLATLGGLLSRGTAAPLPASAEETSFSAERAAAAAEPLVQEPRPAGTAANAEAHEHLAAQLEDAGFEVESQEGIGLRATEGTGSAGYVDNLVATRPGSDPTGTLVLATHLDSVPNAPGAADAGVGLAVILETVRAFGPEALRNDLVLLIVDGEERGLLGAQAYVEGAGQQLREPVVVMNHEARGISGRPLVSRTAGAMHEVLPAMPRPEYESFTDALFGVIPNDTDFTVYRDEAGWSGMDLALIGGSWAYHSPQDDAAHLDAGSLQHYGDLTLALSRDLGERDLSSMEADQGTRPVQTTLPWGILAMPRPLVQALGVLAVGSLAATVLRLRRRGRLRLRGTALGAVLALGALALAGAAAYGLWWATGAARPDILSVAVSEPVRALPFLLADLLAGATILTALWVLARRVVGRAALLAGAGALAQLLIAALAVLAPDFASSMLVPAGAAALGALLGTLLPPRAGTAVRALALAPTGWLVGTQGHSLGEFGIASSAGALAVTTALALAAAAPLFISPATDGAALPRTARRPRRLLAPLLPAVLALSLAIGGIAWTRAAGEPVQESPVATVQSATGRTTWETDGATAWGSDLDGSEASSTIDAAQIEADETDGEAGAASSTTRIRLASPREGAEFELALSEGTFSRVSVDGHALDGTDLRELQINGVPAGHEVVIEAELPRGAQLQVVEIAYAPELAGGWTAPGADVSLVQPRVRILTDVPL